MGNFNINDNPGGNVGAIPWLVQGIKILWRRVNGISSGGSSGNIIANTATLSSGMVTVLTSAVQTGDIIMVSGNTIGSNTTSIYFASTADIVNGTSFIIKGYDPANSNTINISDDSTVNWFIVRST